MTTIDMVKKIASVLDTKKAENINAIKITDLTVIADYFVIANGTSSTQVKALADEVEFRLKEEGVVPIRVEGISSANWIVMDYSNVIVHIFYKDTRALYDLDRLWADGEKINLEFLLK